MSIGGVCFQSTPCLLCRAPALYFVEKPCRALVYQIGYRARIGYTTDIVYLLVVCIAAASAVNRSRLFWK